MENSVDAAKTKRLDILYIFFFSHLETYFTKSKYWIRCQFLQFRFAKLDTCKYQKMAY